jgi:hypothetical protein
LLVYLVKPQIWPFLRAGLAVNPSQNLDTLCVLLGNVLNGTIGKQMVDTLVESAGNVEMILQYFKLFLNLPSQEVKTEGVHVHDRTVVVVVVVVDDDALVDDDDDMFIGFSGHWRRRWNHQRERLQGEVGKH